MWCLLNLETVTLDLGAWVADEHGNENWVVTPTECQPGTICNIIIYSGEEYTPPEGYLLAEEPDGQGFQIGTYVGLPDTDNE